MLNKKNRKPIHPIVRNCLYIIVPVAALVAFKFIGAGASWLIGILLKAGWPVALTFLITFIGCAVLFGWLEVKKGEVDETKEDEEDED